MKYSIDDSTELVLRDLTKDVRPGVITVVVSNMFTRAEKVLREYKVEKHNF